MKYSDKASKYLEFKGIENPNRYQREQIAKLHDQLFAAGLNPQRTNGLTYRASVYDNMKLVEAFLELHDKKKTTGNMIGQLKRFGINTDKPQELRHIVGEIKQQARVADRKKDNRGINLSRKAYEDDCAQVVAEMVAEEKVGEANRLAFGT